MISGMVLKQRKMRGSPMPGRHQIRHLVLLSGGSHTSATYQIGHSHNSARRGGEISPGCNCVGRGTAPSACSKAKL
jgi:hypothetical protein